MLWITIARCFSFPDQCLSDILRFLDVIVLPLLKFQTVEVSDLKRMGNDRKECIRFHISQIYNPEY